MKHLLKISAKSGNRRTLPSAGVGLLQKGGRYKIKGLVFIFLLFSVSSVHAQQEKNYAVYANIIYRFTKYIDWPAEKKSGDFIIGVVGDTPLMEELKKVLLIKKWVIKK